MTGDAHLVLGFLLQPGVPHRLNINEPILADRIFALLCGLSNDGEVSFEPNVVNYSSSVANNVLALGDSSMFVRGSVKKNLRKALRARIHDKAQVNKKIQELCHAYNLSPSDKVTDSNKLAVALARSSIREPKLVVIKRIGGYVNVDTEIDYSRWTGAYVIEIS